MSGLSRARFLGGALGAAGAALLAACGGAGAGGTVTGPIKMAFVPNAEAGKLLENMKPFVEMLQKETGYTFETSVPTSYAAVVEALGAKQVDVAWMGPLAYVIANQKYGAKLMLMSVFQDAKTGAQKRTYPGGIIVKSDSTAKTIQDLKGKKFAFTDPASASGYLYPMDYLAKQGITNPKSFFSEVIFAGGHDKVVAAVLSGQVDGGAIYTDILDRVQTTFPTVKQDIRVLVQTADIPNDGVFSRKDLPEPVFTKVQSGLLAVVGRPEGKQALQKGIGIDGLTKGEDKEYDPLRNAAKVLNMDLEAAIKPAPTATPAR
ncbi:MAG TPA: phosphate/phosphite/phosphonate ABC transporter substrate-binding protein [Chloroflexota bacterium]|nr:phosphate/phosphite/phosphonate ABC transporter substrate-binding protein [Chloroflexota bacterium]